MGWGYFLAEVQPPPEKIEQAEKHTKKTTPALPPPIPVPSQPSALPTPAGDTPKTAPSPSPSQPKLPGNEVMVNVFNGRVNLVFSSKGGTLREVILPEYKDDKGNIVNLVEHQEGAKWPLSLESTDDGISYILQNAYYDVSATTLTLTESIPTGTLTFHLKHESGLEVIREFTFELNSFMVEAKTRIIPGPYGANKAAK